MNFHACRQAALLAVLVALFGGGRASAASEEATGMPLGSVTAAPAGFVELCERAPTECLAVARPSAEALSEVQAWAGRMRWASVFQTAGVGATPAAVPHDEATEVAANPVSARGPALIHAKAGTPQEIRALKDARRKRGSAKPSKTQTVAAPTPIVAEPAERRPTADVSTATLEGVTRRINREIRRAADTDAYSREDVWVLPEGRRPSGDCEDYVLAKRRTLIEEGVDPEALSIAVVRTRRGEVHAVLLVATAEGEQVLDNLSPWVLPWRQAPYEWLERQAPGQPLVWVRTAV